LPLRLHTIRLPYVTPLPVDTEERLQITLKENEYYKNLERAVRDASKAIAALGGHIEIIERW
jgi:hypothetical protein